MADPAELIECIRLSATDYKRATPGTVGQQVSQRILLSECEALLAALTPTPSAEDAAVLDAYVETLPGFERASMGDDTHTDPNFDASDAVVAHNKARAACLARMAGKVPR